jgi:selenocysteine lyase/cysteine desulfurase
MDALETIRSNLVGVNAVYRSPFGLRRVTYADYVASGRPLTHVERVLQEQVMPYYANTHTEDSFTGARTTHLAQEAGDYIKRCLSAEAYKIIFCGTGSTAAIKRMQEILGVAVTSNVREKLLPHLKAEERPVVFVGPYEHHSNEVTWRESLAEVVEIPLDARGGVNLAVLEAALSDPVWGSRIRIGSFSAASNVTGIITDTRSIARLLHAHGAWSCFDFAASAPYVSIDMRPGEPDGYDAVFISPHKFVGGPGTPGILVFNPDMYSLAVPSTSGGGTVTYVSSSTHQFTDDIELREDAGTPAILQKMRAALVFRVKEDVGSALIAERENRFITQAAERLSRNKSIELLGNPDAPRLAVISFLVRSGTRYLHPRFVVTLLSDLFGIQSRGGCACAGPYGHRLLNIDEDRSRRYLDAIQSRYEGIKPGWTRLNFNYFISDEEFAFLLDAIEFIAAYGERFLSLYDFDWQTGAWRHRDAEGQPSLFDLPVVVEEAGPAPYRRYLDEARRLAECLGPHGERSRPATIPEQVAAELVFFTT